MRFLFSLQFFLSLVLSLVVSCSAIAMKLEYYGETSLRTKAKFGKTTIGGLSSIVFHDGKLWALSDDKGNISDPRFYEFDLKIEKGNVRMKPVGVHLLDGFPSLRGEVPLLDTEGFVFLPNGDFLISSENNNDKKPRVPPRIFVVSAQGKYKFDISLPEKFAPEALGKQNHGLHNNAGFEGLTQTPEGRYVFAAAEQPIVTDEIENLDEGETEAGESEVEKRMPSKATEQKKRVEPSVEKAPAQWIRIVKFATKANAKSSGKSDINLEVVSEFAYQMDALSSNKSGIEVFRGVSEILAVNEHKMLMMERGVRLHSLGWRQTVAIYEADLTSAENVADIKNLSKASFRAVKKTKILDFETDLTSRPKKDLQNFEGLAWGPLLPNKKKSLLVVSDNNFSKREITELLVFAVEGE